MGGKAQNKPNPHYYSVLITIIMICVDVISPLFAYVGDSQGTLLKGLNTLMNTFSVLFLLFDNDTAEGYTIHT